MTKKKLLFILILVVSIMAIIITASQIYNIIENNKIIDNNIDGIEGDEDKLDDNYGIISQQITIQLYEWNTSATGLNIDDYLTWVGEEKNDDIYEIERDISTTGANVTNEYLKIKLKFNINEIVQEGQIYSVNRGVLTDIRPNNGNIEITTQIDRDDKYEEDENGIKYIYTGNNTFEINISAKRIAQYGESSTGTFAYGWFYPSLTFYLEGKYYKKTTTDYKYGNNYILSIDSNELLQVDTTIDNKKLSQYIYEQITGEWGKGKETATLKCSIGEYYDESGNLAISTKNNDLPMTFNIRDLVIPYIPTARGGTEPMSIRQDGKAKIFQVTQVRPYFDGACWQEIMLQEYTGDNPSANKA